MRLVAAFATALMLLCLGALPSHAEKRVALVVGNGAYQHADKLSNPVTDARRLKEALDKLGFEIVYGENLDQQSLRRTIGRFANAAQDADVALVFYAGHGATFGDVPYVVPVDAQFSSLGEMPYELVQVETLIGELRRAKGLRIAILDACRDNSAERELKQVAAVRGGGEITRGLARVKNPEGLILAYATQHMSTAADGPPNGDSPFTTALLNNITTPGLDVKDLFFKVGREVIASTMGRQRPEVSVSFYDPYVLVPAGPGAAVTPPLVPPRDQAAQAWTAGVKDTTSQAVLDDFIRRYGDTIYGTLAREKLDALRKAGQVAVVKPPDTPPRPADPCSGVLLSSQRATPLCAAEERSLKPKDVFKECDKCPEMVVVPAGSFTMGSPASENGHAIWEEPQHAVTFDGPFAVGKFSVTFAEWDACVADGGCNGYRPPDQSWGRGRRPVINLTWDNAKTYVAWLSKKTGKPYRLLSEAEREYVTRAGTTTPFWWGTSINPRQANYRGDLAYDNGVKGEYRKQTLPVETFEPNAWGLYQVHGNVFEWVEDCWHDRYKGAPSDGSAWIESGGCSGVPLSPGSSIPRGHVIRGGAWSSGPVLLRSASHNINIPPENHNSEIGFRGGRTLNPH
jgi:formylglycine-generating enzyme required for sulfatase activity